MNVPNLALVCSWNALKILISFVPAWAVLLGKDKISAKFVDGVYG